MNTILECGQYDLGRERQRRHHSPRRKGAVVGSVGHAAPYIVEESALDTTHFDAGGAGALTRGKSPAMRAIAREFERVGDRVLPLHISRAPAVLEIVDALVAHEVVLNATKVDPDMRELVREQRPRV